MKIVFMGTPEFSVTVLDRILQSGFHVVGVVTMPDKPAGRGLNLIHSPVKEYALKKGLPILQPTNLKGEEFISQLKVLNPDLQVVVAFRMLPEVVWNLPPLGTYNLHASLLPQYRGAAPINWAIINGEKFSGITTFKLQHEIDTGNVLLQEKVAITETMNAGELHDVLMDKGSDLVVKSLFLIQEGSASLKSQEDLSVDLLSLKHAPKIFKEDCKIKFSSPTESVYNFIRGLSPYPGAWALLKQSDKEPVNVKIFSSECTNESCSTTPGLIRTDNKESLQVACGDFWISIKEIQIQGKKRMPVKELLNGFKFNAGDHFE